MDARTLVRIALCVAGVIRVSKDWTVFELPFKKGLDAYKLERKMHPKSKDALNSIVKSHGGGRLKFQDDHLEFRIPEENAQAFADELQDWAKLDRKGGGLLQMNRVIQYPFRSVDTESDPSKGIFDPNPPKPDLKSRLNPPAPKPPPSKDAPEPKKMTVQDESDLGRLQKSEPGSKSPKRQEKPSKNQEKPAKAPSSGGFRVEVPLNMRGLLKRLQANPHIKSILDEYKGQTGKGDGLVLEFPDKRQRSEILNELSDAITSSGFLNQVLDTSEI